MVEAELIVDYESGIHARPAALFVQVASKFSSRILIQKGDREIDAKSVMGVMSLNIASGDKIILKIDGYDEVEAMEAMTKLIKFDLNEMIGT
ncbi:MAG: HPr family phosphocarrier protein [Clostridiales bacterium]|nr:HPr family phosphocarrier protein [Clostridiales bacterium]